MRRMSMFRLWPIFLILGVLLLGCARPATEPDAPPSPTQATALDEVRRDLNQMQTQWQAQGLTDYRFQFRWECFCPEGYRELVWVKVIDGEIESVETVEPDLDVVLPERTEYRTIDELFELIGDGVEQGAFEIRVKYDDTMGYPTSAYIDYDVNAVDEERGFQVSELEVLG